MEVEVSGAKPIGYQTERAKSKKDRVRVNGKTLEALLEQWRGALERLSNTGCVDDDDEDTEDDGDADGKEESSEGSSALCRDKETDEFFNLLKSGVQCPDFLEKLEIAQVSVSQNMAAEGSSWDMISKNDLWEHGNIEVDEEDYVLVRQEDIVESIAFFMAAYLLSLKQTKDLSPQQLQEAMRKALSLKKKKGKLRKAWDGTQVIYNVASWGATAIGIYQNPALLSAASAAFWTSYGVISKLL